MENEPPDDAVIVDHERFDNDVQDNEVLNDIVVSENGENKWNSETLSVWYDNESSIRSNYHMATMIRTFSVMMVYAEWSI